MTAVTASQVKELRQLTGAGMADCKKALVENAGELEAARNWLRARGAALAERKADRETKEGLIVIANDASKGVIVELLAETDFVTSNETFKTFANNVAAALLASAEPTADLATLTHNGQSVEDMRTEATLQIGEKIVLGRSQVVTATGQLASYVHHDGKIGVLADFTGLDDTQRRQICMHIASMKPECLAEADFDQDEIATQRASLLEAAQDSGKPPEVQQKIVDGKIKKLIAERTLLLQDYVWEDKLTVGAFLQQHSAQLHSFALLYLG